MLRHLRYCRVLTGGRNLLALWVCCIAGCGSNDARATVPIAPQAGAGANGATQAGGGSAQGGDRSTGVTTTVGGYVAYGGGDTAGGTASLGGASVNVETNKTGGSASVGSSAAVGGSSRGGAAALGGASAGGKSASGSSASGGNMPAGGTAFGGSNAGGKSSTVGGTSAGGATGGTIVPGLNNPIIRHLYTADPAALVHNDTLYVYTGHDEAPTNGTAFVMRDWHAFSSKDMAHWTDHGAVLSLSAFSWASANAWAGQVVERNGKFYWYVPVSQRTGGFGIGVAVGSSPLGPFTDARGSALITNSMTTNVTIDWDDIDPSVFVDDDGQAYLYWGNTSCKVVRLGSDMISTTGAFTYLNLPGFTEAPYINKINGTYYLSYASGMPESIVYATSNNPLGPFTRRGTLNATIPNSPTNHQSLVQFRSAWYFVYHSAALPGGGEFHRSVAIDALTLNSDGTFRQLAQTAAGITQLDPGPFRSDVYHRITSRAGARVLDVASASTMSGANVQQSTWTAANSQQWKLSAVGSGTYQIVNRQSGHCVEVLNGGLTEGVNVQQATCSKVNQQYWRLVGTQAGDYAFINVATGKALGLAPNATGEGANIAQYAYAGAPTHSWQVAIAP